MNKKFLTAVLTAGMAVSCLAAFAACGEQKAFDAPESVQVTGTTLSWSAVEGADNGYTVRVGEDDAKTVSVSAVTLSLAEGKIVEYFTEGANSLSVKVNATDKKAESVYSATATYTYSALPPEQTALAKPANLAVANGVLSWNAVTGATNGYIVSYGENSVEVTATQIDLTEKAGQLNLPEGKEVSITVKAKATDSHLESAAAEIKYNVPGVSAEEKAQKIAEAKAELQGYVDGLPDSETYTEAQAEAVVVAVQAAEGKYADYPAYVKEDGDVAALYATLTAAKQTALQAIAAAELQRNIDAAKTELQAYAAQLPDDLTALTDSAAEALLAAVGGAEEKYNGYAAEVKNDNEVSALYARITNAVTAAQNKIAATVNALKTAVEALTGEIPADNLNRDYYETLEGYIAQIDALGAYANTLCNAAEMKQKVEAEKTALVEKPVNEKSDVAVFVDGAENNKITILYEATNVFGEKIEFTNVPVLTLTVDSATTNPVSPVLTGKDGLYTYTATFSKKVGADYQLKVIYKIGNGEEKTFEYTEFKDDIYFMPNDFYAIVDGKISFSGGDAYFDIYTTDAIALDANGGLPTVTGFPLITGVPVSSGMTEEVFRRNLARSYPDLLDKEYEVRFVVYRKTVNEDTGAITISNIKNALVSHDTYTLDLTEYDVKEAIDAGAVFDLGVWPSTGNFSLITVAQVENFAAQFNGKVDGVTVTAENAEEYFQIKITAYGKETDKEEFFKVVPFANQAYDYFSFMTEWASYFFKNGGEDNATVNFYLTLTIQLKDTVNGVANPLAAYFRDSKQANVSQSSDYTGTYTFSKSTVTVPTTIQINRTNEPIFFQGFSMANDIINGHISYVELRFARQENASEYYTAYVLYNAETEQFSLHAKLDGSDAGKALSKGGNEYWIPANDLNVWINENYELDDGVTFSIDSADWYFCTKAVNNEEDDYYLFGEGVSEWKTFGTVSD